MELRNGLGPTWSVARRETNQHVKHSQFGSVDIRYLLDQKSNLNAYAQRQRVLKCCSNFPALWANAHAPELLKFVQEKSNAAIKANAIHDLHEIIYESSMMLPRSDT